MQKAYEVLKCLGVNNGYDWAEMLQLLSKNPIEKKSKKPAPRRRSARAFYTRS